RHRHHRAVRQVIHELRVDVLERPAHHQPGTLSRAFYPLPDAQVPALTPLGARSGLVHGLHRLLASRLAGLPPYLLAHILDALSLVRFGRTEAAQFGGNLAHHFLVRALDDDL